MSPSYNRFKMNAKGAIVTLCGYALVIAFTIAGFAVVTATLFAGN